jgi:Sulfotransferase domain
MTLPNFLIIGAQKGGTTSLYEYLRRHPQVFMPEPKEINFFVEIFNWRRGLEWYESNFKDAGEKRAVGEASPAYSIYPAFPGVPERIAQTLGEVRLIYLLRDPIERMRSGYLNALARGAEHRPIREALLSDDHYLCASSYALQIEHYLQFFDRSQMLLVLSEDLRFARQETLTHVFEFLGIQSDWRPPNLTTEYHLSDNKRRPRRAARRLDGTWVGARMGLRPGHWEEGTISPRVWRAITQPIKDEETIIDAETRQQLTKLLQRDMKRLKEYLTPDFGGWGLLP